MSKIKYWEQSEIDYLSNNYGKIPASEMIFLDRTSVSIQKKARSLGLSSGLTGFLKGEDNLAKRLDIRKKISLSLIGRIRPDLSNALMGRILTKKSKRKMSLKKRGKSWEEIYGEDIAILRIKKVSIMMKKRWRDKSFRKKMVNIHLEKNKDDEWKENRMRASRCGSGVGFNIPEQQIMQIVNFNNLSFEYVGDGKVNLKGFCPDFIDENSKKIIEVFGEYWHSLPRYKDLDRRRLEVYRMLGYAVLIIWCKELMDIQKVTEKIINFVEVGYGR
jgi:very-short-patch-repair endonuclease